MRPPVWEGIVGVLAVFVGRGISREGVSLRPLARYFWAFGLCLVWFSAGEAAERRVALVIGNSAYAFAGRLANPANDAVDVAAALKRLGFDVSLHIDVDGMALDKAADAFLTKARGAAVAMFYYAGHGLQHDGGAYLAPVDARLENEFAIKRETFFAQEFVKALEGAARVNVVVLDACRNNPLAEHLRGSLQTRQRSAVVGRGLGRIEVGSGNMLLVYSAAPGQEATDGEGRNSPFTAALLKHIETPGLEVEQMLKRVTADVDESTDHKQQPERLSRLKLELWFKPGAALSEAEQRNADLDRREAELNHREAELKRQKAGPASPGGSSSAGSSTAALASVSPLAKPELRVAALRSLPEDEAEQTAAIPALTINGAEAGGWGLKKRVWLDGALSASAVNVSRSLFAVGGQRDGKVHVFDATFMAERYVFQLPQYDRFTLDDVFILGGGQVAGVTRKGAVELYNPADGAPVGQIAARPGFDRGLIRVSRNGRLVYFVRTSIQQQRSILSVFERRADAFYLLEEIAFDARIDSLDASRDDRLLLLGVYPKNEIRLYDRAGKKVVWSRQCDCSAKFGAGDRTVAFAGRLGPDAGDYSKGARIGLIEAANPDKMRVYDPKTLETLTVSDVSPDGTLFLVTSTNNGLVAVMPASFNSVAHLEGGALSPLKVLADNSRQNVAGAFFLRGPAAVVSASADNNVRFWGGK